MKCTAPGASALLSNPYRIFFPIGLFFGISGVFHWILFGFMGGAWDVPLHLALQFPGYILIVATGFLFTSVPRITATGPLRRHEAIGLAFGVAVVTVAGIFRTMIWIGAASVVYGAIAVLFIGRRHRRAPGRFPPSLPWIYVGFGCLISGGALEIVGVRAAPLWTQGLILPFIFATAPIIGAHVAGRVPAFGGSKLKCSLQLGALLGSLLLEIFGPLESRFLAHLLRAAAVISVALDTRLFARPERPRAHSHYFRISAIAIALGYILAAAVPTMSANLLHISFIAGISLMIGTVVWHVAIAHAGEPEAFDRLAPWFHLFGVSVLLSALLRSTAGLLPLDFARTLGAAGALWVAGHVALGAALLPRFLKTP